MKVLSKAELEEKAQAYLATSKKASCLICEDGSIFDPDKQPYARDRSLYLVRLNKGFKGSVEEVKAKTTTKAKPEAKAPAEAAEAVKPKTRSRKAKPSK